jgi:hypothetical protein
MRALVLPWTVMLITHPLLSGAPVASGPMTISGKSGISLENLHITSTAGPCVVITNSSIVTLHNVEVGPCAGNGIVISGGGGIRILDSYIHPENTARACCDSGDGIFASNTTNLLIQGNVIAWGEDNILVTQTSGATIAGNFLLNPRNYGGNRGANIQIYNGSHDIAIRNNYTLASLDASRHRIAANQSDSINLVGGAAHVRSIVVEKNYVAGGFWVNGCGMIADTGADDIHFLDNTLVDTGQCGIGIADGVNQVIDGNRIINSTPVAGGGNTAIYVWKVYPTDPPCGNVVIKNNVASQLKPDMVTESGFWNGGGCEPIKASGNVLDAPARARLRPVSSKLRPPLIPPEPFSCVVSSPFSTQTRLHRCDPARSGQNGRNKQTQSLRMNAQMPARWFGTRALLLSAVLVLLVELIAYRLTRRRRILIHEQIDGNSEGWSGCWVSAIVSSERSHVRNRHRLREGSYVVPGRVVRRPGLRESIAGPGHSQPDRGSS